MPLDVEVEAGGLELRTLPVGPSFAATLAGAVEPIRFWRC
jgi:hypothetical protein